MLDDSAISDSLDVDPRNVIRFFVDGTPPNSPRCAIQAIGMIV